MSLSRLALGFILGVIAVITFHQLTVVAVGLLGIAPVTPYNFTGKNGFGVPIILNQCFWGGLWGVLFVYLYDRMASLPAWLFGLLFGMIGPALLGNFIVLPLLRGQPMFAGFVPARILLTLTINGMYGLGLGVLLPLVAKFLPPALGGSRA